MVQFNSTIRCNSIEPLLAPGLLRQRAADSCAAGAAADGRAHGAAAQPVRGVARTKLSKFSSLRHIIQYMIQIYKYMNIYIYTYIYI